MGLPRILCIMGSGETAPTMASVHIEVLDRLGESSTAVFIDTPFGFQENADELVSRAREYFSRSVGHDLDVASFRSAQGSTELERETCASRIATAGYVFAGPGSPTYALEQWRDSPIPDLLREKLRHGGAVTFASAAAVSLGTVALPVYEIYKVGHPVHWLEGLDLLREADLHVAVVPHYNNAEGGTHDTRFCYMGERRLRLLEELMPEGTSVLGVDEHTALILDLDADTATVRGRGRVVHRRRDGETVMESGDQVGIGELRGRTGTRSAKPAARPSPLAEAAAPAPPFREIVEAQVRSFEEAEASSDVDAMVAAILALDSALAEWANDSDGTDAADVGRRSLRSCIVRLGEIAREGAIDPRVRVAPFVEAMLTMREEARRQRRYADADRVRDLLVDTGVEVRDSRGGSEWVLEKR